MFFRGEATSQPAFLPARVGIATPLERAPAARKDKNAVSFKKYSHHEIALGIGMALSEK
jgi:hypothetical protein